MEEKYYDFKLNHKYLIIEEKHTKKLLLKQKNLLQLTITQLCTPNLKIVFDFSF